MSTRQDYITAIGNLVGGELPLSEAEKIAAIGMAIKEHSRHSPLVVVEDETGDGGFDYPVTDLESWADGFSAIKQVEYPVYDDDETLYILQEDAWMMYEKPAGKYLRFLGDKPPTTESFRVTYTAIHDCTDVACTVKAFDDGAVQALAASFSARCWQPITPRWGIPPSRRTVWTIRASPGTTRPGPRPGAAFILATWALRKAMLGRHP